MAELAYGAKVEPRFLTLAEVAEVLDTSTRAVYALVRSGELQGLQVGGRNQWRVSNIALQEYIEGNDDGPDPVGAFVPA
jgi:excisionase family DNA binding protein